MSSFRGKVLFVDLTKEKVVEKELSEATYRAFLGGAGLGTRMIYERMKPGIDPLGAENILGFVPGLLTGTPMPMTNKCVFMAKSPLTHTWGDSNSGGFFGPALKAAGYDALFFTGKADEPVYLSINDRNSEIRNAGHLWGKDTIETMEILVQELGGKKTGIACIGPAGERRSLISSIVTDNVRVAGRSGIGAVMGSKRLKAVVVKGSSKRLMRNKKRFDELRKETLSHLHNLDSLPFMNNLSKSGTCSGPLVLVPAGASPIKNWSTAGAESFPDYEKIGGPNILKYQLKKTGCGNCPINCGGIVSIEEGPYATKGRKPEYETLAAYGTMLANSNAESIIKANDLSDRFGLDTISTGSVIAFAMECYERGVITKEKTDGIELTWGNASAIINLLEKIAKREGFGEILADGVQKASRLIGKGSERWAIHVHGQEPGYHDPRLYEYRGLGYIAGAAPGRHMISQTSMRLEREDKIAPYPELQKPKANDRLDQMGKIHAIAGSYNQAFSDCGMCLFALSDGSNIRLPDIINAFTGWDMTAEELLTTGKRIVTLRQSFNIREGLRATDFNLPDRIGQPPVSGPLTGRKIDFNAVRRSYFNAMNWDPETGIPSQTCMEKLGLEELMEQFT